MRGGIGEPVAQPCPLAVHGDGSHDFEEAANGIIANGMSGCPGAFCISCGMVIRLEQPVMREAGYTPIGSLDLHGERP